MYPSLPYGYLTINCHTLKKLTSVYLSDLTFCSLSLSECYMGCLEQAVAHTKTELSKWLIDCFKMGQWYYHSIVVLAHYCVLCRRLFSAISCCVATTWSAFMLSACMLLPFMLQTCVLLIPLCLVLQLIAKVGSIAETTAHAVHKCPLRVFALSMVRSAQHNSQAPFLLPTAYFQPLLVCNKVLTLLCTSAWFASDPVANWLDSLPTYPFVTVY